MLIHYWGCSLRKAWVKGKAEWGNKAGKANVRGVQASWPQLCSTRSWLSGLTEARGNYCIQNRSSGGKEGGEASQLVPSCFLSLSGCCSTGCDLHNSSGLCTWQVQAVAEEARASAGWSLLVTRAALGSFVCGRVQGSREAIARATLAEVKTEAMIYDERWS